MDKAKRKLLEQTHKIIMEVGFESNNPELLINITSPDIVAFGSTKDENIFGIEDLKDLLKKQKEQSQSLDLSYNLNTSSTHLSKDENNAVIVDEVKINIRTEEDVIEMLIRFSLVLEYVENKWIMVHFHTSKPEDVESEKDTWGIDPWKAKAEELEKEVAQRTADLVLKNRDLSIENALERVRARSMAMQSSDELEAIIQVVYDQFAKLGITLDHAGFIIDYKTNDDMIIWLADAHKVTPQIRLSYFDSPHWNSYVEAKDKGPKLFVNHLNFKVKNKFYKEIFKQVPALPEDAKDYYLKIPSLTIATVLIDTIGLYIENFSGVQYDDEDQKVLLRFGEVFQQTYTRFLDIQKAESQAREARIEAALERVRGRAMAIRESGELDEVIQIIFHELGGLDINLTECSIVAYDTKPRDLIFWSAGPMGSAQSSSTKLQYIDHPILEDLFKDFENGVQYRTGEFSGKLLKTWWHRVFSETDFRNAPKEFMEAWKKVKRIYYSQFAMTHGFLEFIGEVPLQEENVQILKRFTNVIDLTYTRYDDVVKAEAQAREAQIQLSLERVRAKSMAMQSSDELHDVIGIVFQQFDNLKIQPVNVFLSLFDREKRVLTYRASGKSGNRMPTKQTIDIDSVDAWSDLYNKWINDSSDAIEVIFYPKELVPDILNLLKDTFLAMPKEDRMTTKDFPEGGYSTLGYTPFGYIGYDHTRPPTEEEKDILNRICTEFGRVYQRFLDIEKAEAQAREAKIEATLERVRSRSLAMHDSEELREVISLVLKSLGELGMDMDQRVAAIFTFEEDSKDYYQWVASKEYSAILSLQTPYIDHPVQNDIWNARKNQTEFHSKSYTIEEKNSLFRYFFEHTELKTNMSEKDKKHALAFKFYDIAIAFKKHSALILVSHSGKQFTEDENDIIKRFAKVFEQAYIRFLDLQKAEAQTREAQIEAALEKVRSRSMGMQKSTELLEVISVVSQQLQTLGFRFSHVSFINNSLKEQNSFWVAATGLPNPMRFIIPYKAMPMIDNLRKAQKNKLEFYTNVSTIKEHQEWFKHLLNHSGENVFPKGIIDYQMSKGLARSVSIHTNIMLALANTQSEPYSDYENKIIARFGQVFEQSYTRFLDLERAEAQAREAQIEMALEKVRSRTMTMQNSSELPEAANNLFLQVQELGIPAWSAGYCIWNEDKTLANCNMSSEGEIQKGFMLPTIGEGYDFHKPLNKGEKFHVSSLGGKELVKHYEFMKTLPGMGEILSELINSGLELPTFQIFHICYFKHGYVMFITYEPVPNAHDIFKRFSAVFEQTYTRFLDLKQAEARARESQIQTALERVRSQSLGMQNSSDFGNVTTEMFNQLRDFGEDLFATGIVFCDKHEEHVEQWHSIPEGGMLSPMIVPVDLDYIHQYRYEQWKAGAKLFSIEIPSDFIEQHFEAIFKLPSAQITLKDLESRNAPMPETPKWEIDYGASFKNGYILISSLKPLENTDILPRFAQVFEQAYTRFLDLERSEAQAREAKIEAALEKVRSRTLAMQKSDELAETSVVVFRELLALGIQPNRLFIGIIKENTDAIEAWATNEDGSKIEQQFKLHTSKNKSIKKIVDGWKQQKKSIIIDMVGKELQAYFHYLNDVMQIPFIGGLKQKRRVQTIAYFSGGLIGMAAPDEQPQDTINLLERFAAVFNLTYTRFNDLKIAEAQALQAKEDLINLQKAKKNAEEALTELQSTQKQLIQSEKMASLGELTAGIAHEIQNPLNFVNNFSEVSKELLDEMLEEIENGDMEEVKAIMADVIQNLEKINHHGKRADGIVKGMLQHSRASGDKKEPTDINALADEYLRLAYHGLRAKDKSFNAQLDTDFDTSIGTISVIPQDIGRVILNLLTNAFYAVNEKQKLGIENYAPTVSINSKKKKNNIIITVTDNGEGMPERVKEKIFQPFYTTKPTGQGTGLGLSMSYDIITKGHGGDLKVDTKEGVGTTFRIILPL